MFIIRWICQIWILRMASCWANQLQTPEIIQDTLLKSQAKALLATKPKQPLLRVAVISWEINLNLSKLKTTMEEVSKKRQHLRPIFIRRSSSSLTVVKSHLNQILRSSVKWCIRHSKIILIWETAYSLEMDKIKMVCKELYIRRTTLIKTQITV